MSSQSPVAVDRESTNTFTQEEYCITNFNWKTVVNRKNQSHVNSAPSTFTNYIRKNYCRDISSLSCELERYPNLHYGKLKSGTSIPNPYSIENSFTGLFSKCSLSGSNKVSKAIESNEISSNLELVVKQICSALLIQNSDFNTAAPVDVFSKDNSKQCRKWATWKQLETPVVNQSKRFIEKLSDAVRQYNAENAYALLEFVKEYNRHFPLKSAPATFNKRNIVLQKDEHSTSEAISKQNFLMTRKDSNRFSKKRTVQPFSKVISKPKPSKTALTGNETTMKNRLAATENKFEKQISPFKKDDFDLEFEASLLKSLSELLITDEDTEFSDDANLALEHTFSNRILSITHDNSNSDFEQLEEDLNLIYRSRYADLFQWENKFDNVSSIWKYDQVNCSDDCLSQTKLEFQSSDVQWSERENEKCESIREVNPTIKRSRVDSVDSGISLDCATEGFLLPESSLDSNLERTLPMESNSHEALSVSPCKKEVSECTSVLNSTELLSYTDCVVICLFCKKLVLNNHSLSSRFGLLLNCSHPYCYSCIRHHSKSERLSTASVKCPECDKLSPGIVASHRWISDMSEKTVLFHAYKKESELFYNRQQVFFKDIFPNLK